MSVILSEAKEPKPGYGSFASLRMTLVGSGWPQNDSSSSTILTSYGSGESSSSAMV